MNTPFSTPEDIDRNLEGFYRHAQMRMAERDKLLKEREKLLRKREQKKAETVTAFKARLRQKLQKSAG